MKKDGRKNIMMVQCSHIAVIYVVSIKVCLVAWWSDLALTIYFRIYSQCWVVYVVCLECALLSSISDFITWWE